MTKASQEMVHVAQRARELAQAARAQEEERATELLAHIRRNLGLITDAFYEVGENLAELHNNRLYQSLGYATFPGFLAGETLMGPAQAAKLIAVAQLVPRESAVKLGPEKSYALTRYVRAATEPDGVAGLLAQGNIDGRPLEEVTVREITEITRKLGGKRNGAGREAARLARDAQAALRKRAGTAVKVTTGRGGAFLIQLDAAALRRLAALR